MQAAYPITSLAKRNRFWQYLRVTLSRRNRKNHALRLFLYFVSEKFTRVACYNFDIHEPILIILNEIAPFHLNAACSFANKHEKQAKYQLYGTCSKLKFHCQNYRQYYLNKC